MTKESSQDTLENTFLLDDEIRCVKDLMRHYYVAYMTPRMCLILDILLSVACPYHLRR